MWVICAQHVWLQPSRPLLPLLLLLLLLWVYCYHRLHDCSTPG
jgi:hypothetical protein